MPCSLANLCKDAPIFPLTLQLIESKFKEPSIQQNAQVKVELQLNEKRTTNFMHCRSSNNKNLSAVIFIKHVSWKKESDRHRHAD